MNEDLSFHQTVARYIEKDPDEKKNFDSLVIG